MLKLGISIFIYLRIYSPHERIFLSNNPAWNEHFLTNYYNLRYFITYRFEETIQNNLLVLPEFIPHNPAFKDAKDIFKFDNAFVLTSHNSQYKEIYYFGSKDEKLFTQNYYQQNIDLLDRFVSYFKEKAKPIINLIDKYRFKTPQEYLNNMQMNLIQPITSFRLSDNLRQSFLLETKCDRYFLLNDRENRYLTQKEYECIQWAIKGKSAEEIGIIMNLSKRTVEKYLENLKAKYRCSKLSQLIYILARYGLQF